MSGEELIALSTAVYNKYYSKEKVLRDDLISEGVLAMLNAQDKFNDVGFNLLSTYFWTCAKNGMAQFIRRENKYREHVIAKDLSTIQEFVQATDDYVNDEEYLEGIEKVKCVGLKSSWSDRTKDMINEIFSGETQAVIAKRHGVSRQCVSSAFERVKKKATKVYSFIDGELVEKEKLNVQYKKTKQYGGANCGSAKRYEDEQGRGC